MAEPTTDDREWWTDFGSRIRRARKAADWTQLRLGNALDLTRASINNIEHGRQRIDVHRLLRIADALNVNTAELIGEHTAAPKLGPGRAAADEARRTAAAGRAFATASDIFGDQLTNLVRALDQFTGTLAPSATRTP